ncbi:hypothetical protein ES703_94606 [subsurface metagenome]
MLTRIEDVVEVAKTLSRSWFRGHSRIHGELTPRLFRTQYDSIRKMRPEFELSLIEAFKRGAPPLQANIPKTEDHIAWLFLMQHHGAPTRLLDWTKSALVALYFVVSEHPSENGELWAMYPDDLNEQSGFHGIPLPNHPILQYFAQEPWRDPKKLVEELGLPDIPNHPLAVEPPMNFPRMVGQLSTFTIHPTPKPGNSIPELLPEEKDLVRYIIPASSKESLRRDLNALGIKHGTLFPNLDSLSIDVIYEHRVVAYSPPRPPRFDC